MLVPTVAAIDAEVLDKAGPAAARSVRGECGANSAPPGKRRPPVNPSSWPTANSRTYSTPSFDASRWVRFFYRTAPRCRRGSVAGLRRPAARPFCCGRRARQAVQSQGRSLLPIGVVQVVGSFGKGDVVALVRDAEGVEVRGAA